jgi:aspartyl-tRNA(Asn)/glutamyl-tRNA(Gln) amidotransferase subunit B
MNTFRGVRDALTYEAARQQDALLKGETILQETRLWDAAKMKTIVMRSKEEAHDYRYFPEPDLLDFSVPKELIERQMQSVGELPLDKKKRFQKEYQLGEKDIDIILSDKFLADFFEAAVKAYPKPKEIANWLLGVFLEQINNFENKFAAVKISAQNFSKIVQYFCENKLNNLAVKKVIVLSIATGDDIDALIEKEGLSQVSNTQDLIGFVQEAIKENEKPVKEYRQGREQALMFLVGCVMKKSKGKANPKVARDLLLKALNK